MTTEHRCAESYCDETADVFTLWVTREYGTDEEAHLALCPVHASKLVPALVAARERNCNEDASVTVEIDPDLARKVLQAAVTEGLTDLLLATAPDDSGIGGSRKP